MGCTSTEDSRWMLESSNVADAQGLLRLFLDGSLCLLGEKVTLDISSSVLRPVKGGKTKLTVRRLTLQHQVLFVSSSSALPLFPTAFSSMSALSASNQYSLLLHSHRPLHLLRRLRPSR